jgi:DNA-binding response OmpR family regulator
VRVLVIEDEVNVATGVQRCLSADGFDVEVVHDGAVGLERVRADQFDLIVLDIHVVERIHPEEMSWLSSLATP